MRHIYAITLLLVYLTSTYNWALILHFDWLIWEPYTWSDPNLQPLAQKTRGFTAEAWVPLHTPVGSRSSRIFH